MSNKDANGRILYEGPSMLDGEPVIAVLILHSTNSKTGDMSQVYILRADVSPLEAIRTGQDESICGDCIHRPANVGSCYVEVGRAPENIYRTWRAGKYPWFDAGELLESRPTRLGAYGDPAALPFSVLAMAYEYSGWNFTSYTSQWKQSRFGHHKRHMMASVKTPEEAFEATARGWRHFRVKLPEEGQLTNEIICPATTSEMYCIDCKLCNGKRANTDLRRNICIDVHGSTGKEVLYKIERRQLKLF